MKRILLSAAFLLGLPLAAQAQCVGVAGINTVPVPGIVCNQDSIVSTYAATGIGIVPAATPTDIAWLTGSATRTIRVKRIRVGGTAGTAINIVATLMKRASADTGGTAGTTTAVPVPYPLDSTYTAATATAISYTANPTIVDSTPGVLDAETIFLPATGTASASRPALYDLGLNLATSPVVLRGIAQQLCVNLGGVTTPSSGLMTVSFTWTEQTQ